MFPELKSVESNSIARAWQGASTLNARCLFGYSGSVPPPHIIQMAPFLPFQSQEKVIFTAGTAAQRNGTVVAKQALILIKAPIPSLDLSASHVSIRSIVTPPTAIHLSFC